MTSVPPELIIVGRVRKAHGIRGELVVEPITDEPDAVFASGRRVIAGTSSGDPAKDRRELSILSSRPFKGGMLVHFSDITDRAGAELWRDRFLLVPADELEPLGDDQVYIHDLLGMAVQLESGAPVGTVVETYELPQGLALEVGREKGTVLIPYDRIVTRVDRERRVIQIDPPAGLLDD